MKTVFKSILAIMLAALMLASFAACNRGGNNSGDKGGTPTLAPTGSDSYTAAPVKTPAPTMRPDVSAITYTIDATAAVSSGRLSGEVLGKLENNGMLLNKAKVTMLNDQKLSATFKLFKTRGIEIETENDRIVSVQGLANGDCGEGSRWVIKHNGQQTDVAVDDIAFGNGDSIEIVYILG